MYILGENPAMSDPDQAHARAALAKPRASGGAGHLPDGNRLARRRCSAGIGPCREVGHLHQHQPRGADMPAGARSSGRGASGLGPGAGNRPNRVGLDWNYTHPKDVFAEMAQVMPSLDNITWERLDREDCGYLSLRRAGPAGQRDHLLVGFSDGERTRRRSSRPTSFRRTSCRTRPTRWCCRPGRLLEHWHTGAMTRRADRLDDAGAGGGRRPQQA